MSLIEVMVATGLFLVAGLIVFSMLQWGLKSAEVGRLQMDSQQQGRLALKRIKDELGEATRLNITMQSGLAPFGSAVMLPNTASASSTDDVVFVKAARSAAQMDTSLMANYRFVRYFVPATNKNRLVRRVYQLKPGIGGAPIGLSVTGNTWTVSTATLDSSNLIETPASDDIVLIDLPGSNDRVTFKVAHGAVNSGSDSFGASFNRLIFQVEVTVQRYYQNDPKQVPATKTFADAVALPDFVQ
jgi:hypothetical protein